MWREEFTVPWVVAMACEHAEWQDAPVGMYGHRCVGCGLMLTPSAYEKLTSAEKFVTEFDQAGPRVDVTVNVDGTVTERVSKPVRRAQRKKAISARKKAR